MLNSPKQSLTSDIFGMFLQHSCSQVSKKSSYQIEMAANPTKTGLLMIESFPLMLLSLKRSTSAVNCYRYTSTTGPVVQDHFLVVPVFICEFISVYYTSVLPYMAV